MIYFDSIDTRFLFTLFKDDKVFQGLLILIIFCMTNKYMTVHCRYYVENKKSLPSFEECEVIITTYVILI